MRDYSFNPIINKGQLYFNYIAQLDQQVWNLYDYIKEYYSNYQILNDHNNYYSNQELQDLMLYNAQTNTINAKHLNYHQGILNNFHIDMSLDIGTDIILPQGYILLSEVCSNQGNAESEDRNEIHNYLYARVAAPATYYIGSDILAESSTKTRYTGKYQRNAELTHGLSQYYSFLPYGVNFYYCERYNENKIPSKQAISIAGTEVKAPDGSQGTEGYNLNHRLINDNYEEIICDDVRAIEITNVDNESIISYRIIIPNKDNQNNEPFLEKFPMNIRLG